MALEVTIIATAVALWFAHGWYLNSRLARLHAKLDRLIDGMEGLRLYLYEIDPQFDEERRLREEIAEGVRTGAAPLSGMALTELVKRRTAAGRRTLDTPFLMP
jgi:hypothetical protein